MATPPSKREYIEARLTVERIHAERDWIALARPQAASPPAADESKKEITHKDAARYLQRSESYLRKLEQRGRIRRLKRPGRTVYYLLKDIEALKRSLDK